MVICLWCTDRHRQPCIGWFSRSEMSKNKHNIFPLRFSLPQPGIGEALQIYIIFEECIVIGNFDKTFANFL